MTVNEYHPGDRDADNNGSAWPLEHRPSPAFPDRETSRELARARAAESRTTKRRMYAIYVGLLAAMAGFGVLAAYTWERQKDAAEYAAMIATQNEILLARVKELENVGAGLAQAVTAMDRETEAATGQFETSSGPTGPTPPRTEQAKSEPVMQDRAKGDPVDSEQAVEIPVRGAGEPAPAESGDADAEIAITAKTESWVQIVAGDGKPIFTKLMKSGDTHTLPASAGAMLVTGNPTGLELFVDGVAAPAFNVKGPTRREIALDPERLLAGTAEELGRRAPPSTPPPAGPLPN